MQDTEGESAENKDPRAIVRILYTNYRGENAWRSIRPVRIWFGSTKWHPEDQWLLDALDLEKNASRSFAMQDIQAWRAEQE